MGKSSRSVRYNLRSRKSNNNNNFQDPNQYVSRSVSIDPPQSFVYVSDEDHSSYSDDDDNFRSCNVSAENLPHEERSTVSPPKVVRKSSTSYNPLPLTVPNLISPTTSYIPIRVDPTYSQGNSDANTSRNTFKEPTISQKQVSSKSKVSSIPIALSSDAESSDAESVGTRRSSRVSKPPSRYQDMTFTSYKKSKK